MLGAQILLAQENFGCGSSPASMRSGHCGVRLPGVDRAELRRHFRHQLLQESAFCLSFSTAAAAGGPLQLRVEACPGYRLRVGSTPAGVRTPRAWSPVRRHRGNDTGSSNGLDEIGARRCSQAEQILGRYSRGAGNDRSRGPFRRRGAAWILIPERSRVRACSRHFPKALPNVSPRKESQLLTTCCGRARVLVEPIGSNTCRRAIVAAAGGAAARGGPGPRPRRR